MKCSCQFHFARQQVGQSTLTNFNVALSLTLKVASLNCARTELNDGRQLSLQLITSGSYRNSLHPPTALPPPPTFVALCSISHCSAFSHSTLARWAQELLPPAGSSSTWKCVKFCVEMVVRKGLWHGLSLWGEWFNALQYSRISYIIYIFYRAPSVFIRKNM